MLAVHCGPDVQFVGEAINARYASSQWAVRAFCKVCGTHLYYKLLATGEHFMPAGAFDQDDWQERGLTFSPAKAWRPVDVSCLTRTLCATEPLPI